MNSPIFLDRLENIFLPELKRRKNKFLVVLDSAIYHVILTDDAKTHRKSCCEGQLTDASGKWSNLCSD